MCFQPLILRDFLVTAVHVEGTETAVNTFSNREGAYSFSGRCCCQVFPASNTSSLYPGWARASCFSSRYLSHSGTGTCEWWPCSCLMIAGSTAGCKHSIDSKALGTLQAPLTAWQKCWIRKEAEGLKTLQATQQVKAFGEEEWLPITTSCYLPERNGQSQLNAGLIPITSSCGPDATGHYQERSSYQNRCNSLVHGYDLFVLPVSCPCDIPAPRVTRRVQGNSRGQLNVADSSKAFVIKKEQNEGGGWQDCLRWEKAPWAPTSLHRDINVLGKQLSLRSHWPFHSAEIPVFMGSWTSLQKSSFNFSGSRALACAVRISAIKVGAVVATSISISFLGSWDIVLDCISLFCKAGWEA